jgi:serine phosphatase RsbU (regulator of sigma subunit)/anti-sigma regulatory factor (Ser/Thr protein kinase)
MRSSRRWRNLRARMVTWSFVPAVLILVAVAVITLVAYERAVQSETIDHERERAYLSANRLKEEMLKFSEILADLARTEAIYVGDAERQRTTLTEARRRLSMFDGGVVLLDSRGQVVGAQPDRPEIFAHDWSDRPYFRQLLSGESVVFSNTMPDGAGGAPVVTFAVPITGAHNEFLGSLVGMFRLGEPTISALYASLVRLRMGNSVYLVDGTGEVVYHPYPEQIGQSLGDDPIVQQVLAGQMGAIRQRDRSEGDMVVAFAPVPGTPWGLIIEEAWASLNNPSQSYGRVLLLLLVLGILLPAGWFGILARERRNEAVERAHVEHQLHVARLVQQTLLPKGIPDLPGWHVSGHYQPAHAVGGDFYDFLTFEDGRMGLIIGDVTDKGVPAALLMATTRSLLRSIAQRVSSPGQVLQQVNEQLRKEIPPKMFVTCLYAILDPATGRIRYANAGHNLPYRSHPDNGRVTELRATGMPLGLMPGMIYEEMETTISPGECVLFYSDGLVEAHNSQREMFGNPRLRTLLGPCAGDCPTLIQHLLAELEAFVGRGWDQEDDVTLVTLQRTEVTNPGPAPSPSKKEEGREWRALAEFSLPSLPGNEREAIRRVTQAVRDMELPPSRLERLKTAVGEATMNAIEHGNRYDPELKVGIQVLSSQDTVAVRISDEGGSRPIPKPVTPNLEAKLAGLQSPRGWGLFLIENMIDGMAVFQEGDRRVVELVLQRKGETDGNPST